jgi:hypothetical protein
MKKSVVFALMLLVAASVAGCALKKSQVDMNQLAEDNKYHYSNKDLGFSLVLPPEFEYFQTQRVKGGDYNDLEIYVPTSDTTYEQLVSGYGRVITVRVIDSQAWQKSDGPRGFNKIAEKDDKVYAIEFWPTAPVDWQDIWIGEMIEGIKNGFSLVE